MPEACETVRHLALWTSSLGGHRLAPARHEIVHNSAGPAGTYRRRAQSESFAAP